MKLTNQFIKCARFQDSTQYLRIKILLKVNEILTEMRGVNADLYDIQLFLNRG